jgi:hypothetical protein
MSEYMEPEKDQDYNENTESQPANNKNEKATLEKDGPDKSKPTKVLKKDGGLADMPYNNEPGGGPLEGTIGIGT